jgi:hypothetical protein
VVWKSYIEFLTSKNLSRNTPPHNFSRPVTKP